MKSQPARQRRLPLGDICVLPSAAEISEHLAEDAEAMESSSSVEDSPMVMDVSHSQEEEDISSTNSSSSDASSLAIQKRLRGVLDMDLYRQDIYTYLQGSQKKFEPKWNYMTKQPDITFNMRSILVDWLVEVGEEYKLKNETIYLAVNYIDRFLSQMSVQRAKLQLVGTACMFIAS